MNWLTGACNYLWGITLIVWTMVPFRDLALGENRHFSALKLAWVLPGYLLMGTVSENSAPAALLMMLACAVLSTRHRRKVPVWMWIAIAVGCIGFIWMLSSPGSLKRNAGSLDLTKSLLGRFIGPFSNCAQHFLSYAMIPAAAFTILFIIAVEQRVGREYLELSVCLFVCGVAANFAMTATGLYPLRSMTGCLLMILSASFLLMSQLKAPVLRRAATGVLCMYAIVLLMYSLPQTYDRWRTACEREAQAVAACDAGSLSITTWNISGRTKFDVFYDMIDLTDNPKYFSNKVFARYYGLKSVVADQFY